MPTGSAGSRRREEAVATDIRDAMQRLDERKLAADEDVEYGANPAPDLRRRLIASGLDLDPDELRVAEAIAEHTYEMAVAQGFPGPAVAGASFVDGLMTGLLVAEGRREPTEGMTRRVPDPR